MAWDKRQRLKEAAVHSLRVGRPDEALIAGRHLAEQDPNDAEAFQIQGLAHARLGQPDEATAAFREAMRLDPTEGKHPFNLAAHLAAIGEKEEARRLAAEAVRIAPKHPGARRLLDELEGRAVPEAQTVHLLAFLQGREKVWDAIAYGLMIVGLAVAVIRIPRFPGAPTGKPVPKGQLPDVALATDPLSQLTVFLWIATALATFLWIVTDVVDRRKKFTWIVPTTICGVMGLHVAALAIYFFVGRKQGEDGVPKT